MTDKYDRAITVFSPDGRLLQIEYAQEAVKKGSLAIGVRGKDTIVLGVEKKSISKLRESRTVKKICVLDNHVAMTFAGLTADARVLIKKSRVKCQSEKLTFEDPISVKNIANYIASLQQKNTISNGRRPYGVSIIVAGFDMDGSPKLFCTEPAGTYFEWKANAIGGNDKVVREYLEQNYSPAVVENEESSVKFCAKALMQVIQGDHKGMDIAVLKFNQPFKLLSQETISKYIEEIKEEWKIEEEEKKKTPVSVSKI